MSDRKVVIFETADRESEEPLLREYIVPAFDRLDEREDVEWLAFSRYGTDPSIDGGMITFEISGDVTAVTASEHPRWDALVENGFATEWWSDDAEVRVDDFDTQELLRHRLHAVASRMSVVFFKEFDDLPDPITEFGTDEPYQYDEAGVGWWVCLHHIINELGYQSRDGEEELELLFQALRNRFYPLAAGWDARAEPKIDEFIDELEALPSDLRRFQEEWGEHEFYYANREDFETE